MSETNSHPSNYIFLHSVMIGIVLNLQIVVLYTNLPALKLGIPSEKLFVNPLIVLQKRAAKENS